MYGTSPLKVRDAELEETEVVSEGEARDLVIQEEIVQKESPLEKHKTIIKGIIKNQMEKALLIEFKESGEIWIPKSTIHIKFCSISS